MEMIKKNATLEMYVKLNRNGFGKLENCQRKIIQVLSNVNIKMNCKKCKKKDTYLFNR